MAGYRKLGRASDQRKAVLRGQVTDLLWYGKIKTTEARAKELRRIAEKLLTLAINTYDKSEEVVKMVDNEKGQSVKKKVQNDLPAKLNARRKIMAQTYDVKELRLNGESKSDYADRTSEAKHPLVEKMFREHGPKYRERNEKQGCGGGYTRIIKLGPRQGDNAEEAIIELV
jgi:large subunit ribosomal protein L17